MVHSRRGGYDLKGMEKLISTIEEAAKELKGLSGGIPAIDKNADAILALAYLLRINVPDSSEIEP